MSDIFSNRITELVYEECVGPVDAGYTPPDAGPLILTMPEMQAIKKCLVKFAAHEGYGQGGNPYSIHETLIWFLPEAVADWASSPCPVADCAPSAT